MLPCFTYCCAHTNCWDWGFICFLPALRPPSGSCSTGSSGYSSPLGFPTFAMGSPLAGSMIVCPRSKRRFSVPVWVRYTGQFRVGPHTSVCDISALPVPQGGLSGGPRCVHELRLSLALSIVLHCPMLGFRLPPRPFLLVWGCLGYPALLSAGWGFVPRLVAQLAPCSCWRRLTGWSSLQLRVLGGSWFSPLCSPGRRSASQSTCSALPPLSRLSFGLGDFSFG